MGEDLVVFKDRQGQVGVLQLHCCHRGTSLEFGLVSERGLRCCYHGWLFDADGTILDTPGEPAHSTLKDRLFQGAYPTHVYHGIVFVYMGPPDRKPPFPVFDTYVMPGYRARVGVRHEMPANWLQIKENCMDPAHLDFLHTIDGSQGFTPDLRNRADWEYMETPIGMVFVASRRVGDAVWVRMTDFIAPNIHQWSATGDDVQRRRPVARPWMTQWSVPVDDTHTMNFRLRHVKDDYPIEVDAEQVMEFGQDDARPYEERQRVPGDYDAQVGQRPIAIHGLEHLATTDRGVIMVRRILREGIEAVQQGQDPKGVIRDTELTHPHLRQRHHSPQHPARRHTRRGQAPPDGSRPQRSHGVHHRPCGAGRNAVRNHSRSPSNSSKNASSSTVPCSSASALASSMAARSASSTSASASQASMASLTTSSTDLSLSRAALSSAKYLASSTVNVFTIRLPLASWAWNVLAVLYQDRNRICYHLPYP